MLLECEGYECSLTKQPDNVQLERNAYSLVVTTHYPNGNPNLTSRRRNQLSQY